MTREIADAINTTVNPRGVGVVVEGRHLCLEMRGVQKQTSQTLTSCMLGVFRSDADTRSEFLSNIRKSH
jgi:GTP cyclohydrolase I